MSPEPNVTARSGTRVNRHGERLLTLIAEEESADVQPIRSCSRCDRRKTMRAGLLNTPWQLEAPRKAKRRNLVILRHWETFEYNAQTPYIHAHTGASQA